MIFEPCVLATSGAFTVEGMHTDLRAFLYFSLNEDVTRRQIFYCFSSAKHLCFNCCKLGI